MKAMKGMPDMKRKPDCPECMMGRVVDHHSPARLSQKKVGKVMHEFKSGTLHSGSKSGPKVTSRKQAVAIGMSEGRKAMHGGY